MTDYKVVVDDTEFTLDPEKLKSLDIHEPDDGNYHVLHENKGYAVKVIDTDFLNKTLTLSVNGNPYHIKIKDAYDQMVNKMGLLANSTQKLKNINAPMPGLILDIMVKPGDEISEGTPLLILSAMKMENMLRADRDATVKSVNAVAGDSLAVDDVIIEFE